MQQESFFKGVIFTTFSAFGVAIIGLLGKIGVETFPLDALMFWRYAIAFGICLAILGFLQKEKKIFPIQHARLHLLRAFFVLSAQYSFYLYIQMDTLLNGLVLLNLGPVFIPLIEWMITRKRIGTSSWVGLLISFFGMLCVLQPARIFSSFSLIGVLTGVCQGCSQVVFGLSRQSEKTEISTLYLFLFCSVFSFIPYIWHPPLISFDNTHFLMLILALGSASVFSQLMRAMAYKHGTPSRLATFLYFSIFLGGIFDWFIFDKMPNKLSFFGAFLIVLGGSLKIYLRSLFLKKQNRS